MLLIPFMSISQIQDTLGLPFNKALILIFDEQPSFELGVNHLSAKVLPGDNKLVLRYAYDDMKPFEETNLFVQSGNKYYMFIIKYEKVVKNYIHNYQSENLKIGYLGSSDTNTKKPLIDVARENKRIQSEREAFVIDSSFRANALYVDIKEREYYNKGVIGKGRCQLMLTNLLVDDNHLYFKFDIKNKSKIKYEISSFKFFIEPKKGKVKKRVISDQELNIEYFLNEEYKTVEGKSTRSFVMVLNKFTLENDKKLKIKVLEKSGERSLEFELFAEDLYQLKYIQE